MPRMDKKISLHTFEDTTIFYNQFKNKNREIWNRRKHFYPFLPANFAVMVST